MFGLEYGTWVRFDRLAGNIQAQEGNGTVLKYNTVLAAYRKAFRNRQRFSPRQPASLPEGVVPRHLKQIGSSSGLRETAPTGLPQVLDDAPFAGFIVDENMCARNPVRTR